MAVENEEEFEKRLEDIREIRGMLEASKDKPICHPWVFFAWSALLAAGTALHYLLFRMGYIDARSALAWLWCPIGILGAIAESISYVVRTRHEALHILNRRIAGALSASVASIAVIGVLILRLAPAGLSPGIAILLLSLPLVFYTQIFYASMFIEPYVGIAVGLLFELSGAAGPSFFLAAGIFAAALFGASGVHAQILEKRRRG